MMTTIQQDHQIINVLVDAFKDNERINAILRIPNRKNITAFFTYCYHYTKKVGHIYYCEEGNTAILYIQDSRRKILYTFSLWMMKLIIFTFNWSKLKDTIKTNRLVKQIRSNAAKKFGDNDFLYVWFMGGKNPKGGLKGVLNVKDRILEESKKRNLPIYIETTIQRMVPLYENAGFEFYHKQEFGDTTIWFGKK